MEPYDDDEPYDNGYPDDDDERCPECGAYFEEYHDWDCSHSDDDFEYAWDCDSPYHPGCSRCEKRPVADGSADHE